MWVTLWKFLCSSKRLEGCQKATLKLLCKNCMFFSPRDGARSLHTETWCKFRKRSTVSFQYFFLFHKGNFCPFPLTIFILYLNHAWPHVDACGFFPHWKVLLWLISTNRTLDRQTCLQKYTANARMNQQKVYTLTGAAQKNSRFLKQKAKLAALTSVLTSKTHSPRRAPVQTKKLRYNDW